MSRIAIVGGGVIGTALAVEAVDRGHEVVQLERELEPRGASVRNFGLVWICGRARGRELALALEGRRRWEELARRAPAIGFRPVGCLVVARTSEELALLAAACEQDDAEERGFRLVDSPGLGALHSPLDAVVEPSAVLAALRGLAASSGRYSFEPGRTVVETDAGGVSDHRGARVDADLVAICTGTATELIPAERVESARLVRRNLQMLGTAPSAAPPATAIANGDALRYYPAFDLPERSNLPSPDPAVSAFGAQLLVAPRIDGRLTIGDTHTDDRPVAFGRDEDADRYLLRESRELLGAGLPPVERRWTGSYLRRTDGADCALVELTADGRLLVAAAGGMGMTAAPAFAVEALDTAGL